MKALKQRPGTSAGTSARTGDKPHVRASLEYLPVDRIDPHPDNPRDGDDAAQEIDALVPSVQDGGVIQPVVVRPGPGDRYQLVAGERRWRAAKAAGRPDLPAIVKQLTDAEALEYMLVENVLRKALNPIELARGIQRLCRSVAQGGAGKTFAHVAGTLGKAPCWVSNLVRLLRLPDAWQRRVAAGELAWTSARLLVPHAKSTGVLADVEQLLAGPREFWQTRVAFERSLALIVERPKRAGPAAAVPKVPRATPAKLAPATVPLPPRVQEFPGEFLADKHPAVDPVEAIAALVDRLTTHAQIERVERELRRRQGELAATARKEKTKR